MYKNSEHIKQLHPPQDKKMTQLIKVEPFDELRELDLVLNIGKSTI